MERSGNEEVDRGFILIGLAHFLSVLLAYIPLIYPSGSDGKPSVCNAGDLGSILGLGRSSGKGNGTHSSTLAWKILWMEEPGRLQSMGSQRVGHD